MRTLLGLLTLTLMVLGGPASGEVIRIGVVGPMTAMQGQHHWYGATMAAEEINEAGGVLVGDRAYMIELIQVDSNELDGSVDDAVSAVERVIGRVDVLVGGFRTEMVMAMTQTAADHGVPFLIVGAAADGLLSGRVDEDYEQYKYLFRVAPVRSSDLARLSILLLADVVQTFREELGIETPRVSIIAERAAWADGLVAAVTQTVIAPRAMGGLEGALAGAPQRPSALATDVSAELDAAERARAHIIYTALSDRVGIPFGVTWGQLEIPAAAVGINVMAQSGQWLAYTGGSGAYAATAAIYARDVAVTELTIPFVEAFIERFGDLPLYTAATYDALHILKTAVEKAETLDSDAVVVALEDTDHMGTIGRMVFDETHDLVWGPGYVTGVGVQWLDGEALAFWPREWRPDPFEAPELVISYPGAVPYQIPPWVLDHWGTGN